MRTVPPAGPGVSPGEIGVIGICGRIFGGSGVSAGVGVSLHAESVNIVGTRDCLYPGVAAWCGDARGNRAEAPLTVSGEAGGKEMKGETEHVSTCAAP